MKKADDFKRLGGTPWHVGFIYKEEDDPRRHKAHCIHYVSGTKHCKYSSGTCYGSAHCAHYETDQAYYDRVHGIHSDKRGEEDLLWKAHASKGNVKVDIEDQRGKALDLKCLDRLAIVERGDIVTVYSHGEREAFDVNVYLHKELSPVARLSLGKKKGFCFQHGEYRYTIKDIKKNKVKE